MGDLISFVLYLAGFIVSIIVIVALCQLFAIRRGIEALVRLQSVGGSGAANATRADAAVTPAIEQRSSVEPAIPLLPEERRTQMSRVLWGAVAIGTLSLIVLVLTIFAKH